MKLQSFAGRDETHAIWHAQAHHQAFPGVLNGGIIGTLLDCHSNWTAAWMLMRDRNLERPLCTVTAEFSVQLLRPAPVDGPLGLSAKATSIEGDIIHVSAELTADGKVRATCRGRFVAVKPGHPAYHQW